MASQFSPASLLNDIPLDTRTISQDRLNIEGKVRSNLFPWNGQFSPQLVHAFLETYGGAGDFVLDPFMGSGTVLIEAGRLQRRAFGAEINPAAFKMAQVYSFVNASGPSRRESLERVDDILHDAFGSPSLFSAKRRDDQTTGLRDRLVALWDDEDGGSPTRSLFETLIVLLDFHKPDLSPRKILATWQRLFRTVLELPFSQQPLQISNCDARNLPIGCGMVDLVVTSPPYINVFNYHQQYRASVEAMSWDLLHVARSEVGSNRKNRGNRFLTVIQYCLDIHQALEEMRRACKASARMILVVGRESNVLKTRFYNGDIVTRIGVRCLGLIAESRQERVFKNKFGKLIYEDILHFRSSGADKRAGESAAQIAKEVLSEAADYCPKESSSDLQDAIHAISGIPPSPLYQPAPAGQWGKK
ncbi:MAG TPA: DNA methyltransferase [Pirellulales bacterium]|nr:DNA methyltransferase [Pirellulales bacterium]